MKLRNQLPITALLLSALIVSIALPVAAQSAPAAAPVGEDYTPSPELPMGWYARIETSMGRIIVRLLPEQSPESVAHFVGFVRGEIEWVDPVNGETHKEPYYDGSEVYIARGATMFQVGDRSASGVFAPFVYVPGKPEQPVNFHLGWRVGHVAVGPRISATRFLITAGAMPGLNETVPCFGAVLEGQDVVFNITSVKTHRNQRPIEPVKIHRIHIFSIGDPAPLPERVPYIPDVTPVQLQELKLKENPE